MKNGTMYASRLKKAYAKLRQTIPTPELPESDEPLLRLALAILGVESSEDKARAAIDRAFESMVDWNEIRVSSAAELNRATGNSIPHGVERCQLLIHALQSVYDRENQMSLERLRNLGRRDARTYLAQLEGVDDYAAASVVLWSLGGHAIPVNDRLLENLRRAELVNPTASRAEVQAFLERHVSASDAREFCVQMESFSPKKSAGQTRSKGKAKAGSKKKRVASKAK